MPASVQNVPVGGEGMWCRRVVDPQSIEAVALQFRAVAERISARPRAIYIPCAYEGVFVLCRSHRESAHLLMREQCGGQLTPPDILNQNAWSSCILAAAISAARFIPFCPRLSMRIWPESSCHSFLRHCNPNVLQTGLAGPCKHAFTISASLPSKASYAGLKSRTHVARDVGPEDSPVHLVNWRLEEEGRVCQNNVVRVEVKHLGEGRLDNGFSFLRSFVRDNESEPRSSPDPHSPLARTI